MRLQATIDELLARLRGLRYEGEQTFEVPPFVVLGMSLGSDHPDVERSYYGVSQRCVAAAGLSATVVFYTVANDCLVTPFGSRVSGPLELHFQFGTELGFPAAGFGTVVFAGAFSGPRPPETMEFGTAASYAGLGANVAQAAPDDVTTYYPEFLVRAGERCALQHGNLNEGADLGFYWRRLVTAGT